MNGKIWVLILVGFIGAACNQTQDHASLPNSKPAVQKVDSPETNQFRKFVGYFEPLGLPVEVFPNSYFDPKGNRISSLQISGKDDDWLGVCVFEDDAEFRVEDRTPDMDQDESEPISTQWYRVDDNGKIEILEA